MDENEIISDENTIRELAVKEYVNTLTDSLSYVEDAVAAYASDKKALYMATAKEQAIKAAFDVPSVRGYVLWIAAEAVDSVLGCFRKMARDAAYGDCPKNYEDEAIEHIADTVSRCLEGKYV